jgi:hypothetical protein
MQTEHLYAIEQDLAQREVATNLVTKHFDDLHRCPPLPLSTWLTAITAAYNRVTAAVADR